MVKTAKTLFLKIIIFLLFLTAKSQVAPVVRMNLSKNLFRNVGPTYDSLFQEITKSNFNTEEKSQAEYHLKNLKKIANGKPIYPIWDFKSDYPAIDSFNIYLYNHSKISAFQNVSAQLGQNTFVGAEFASFYFGVVRLGINGFFQLSGDTAADAKTNASLQKILTSGGTFSLNAVLPLVVARSNNEQLHFDIFLITSAGFTSSSKFAVDSSLGFVGQSGIDVHFDVRSNEITKGAYLMFDMPVTYVYGSKSSLSQLGLADFGIVSFKGSLSINNLLTFYVQVPVISTSKTINNNYRVLTGGISFSPSEILKAKE